MTPAERYANLVATLVHKPGVTQQGRGFGSSALKVNGAMFATLSARDQFVVKLPRGRVDNIVTAGDGERFDPGHGRMITEWLALRPESKLDWASLAEEAMAYVSAARTRPVTRR